MKMRKKLAALLAAAMIASVMPMTAFAASTNRVTKEVTIAKGDELFKTAPELVINFKDTLKEDEVFYLELENAEWKEYADEDEKVKFDWTTVVATDTSITVSDKSSGLELSRAGSKRLRVKATKDIVTGEDITIPLYVKATGGEASVSIKAEGTSVTEGKYVFAKSDDAKAKIKVADAKTFVEKGEAAKITLEESYKGAFAKTVEEKETEDQVITITLDDKDFSFTQGKGKIEGSLGFDKISDANAKKITVVTDGKQEAKITIPAGTYDGVTQRGIFEITGLEINASRRASEGEVTADIQVTNIVNLEEDVVTLAKYGDYSTGLKTEKVEKFTAGTKKTVKFDLEQVGDAILAGRATVFTFSDDIEVVKVKKAGKSTGTTITKDDKNKNEFEISDLSARVDDNKVAFEVEINIPAKFEGDLTVKAEGRSLEATTEVKLAEVTAPVTVEVEAMSVEIGTRENTGGKVTVTETEKGNLRRGKLVIQLPKELQEDGVEFKNIEDLDIKTTGGIKVKDAVASKTTTAAIEVEVTSVPGKEVGSIEISGFQVKARRTILDGAYDIEVGGTAISSIADLDYDKDGEYNNIDAIASADFLLVGDQGSKAAEVKFVIGSNKITIDGKEVEMDAPAYIKDGRTMVPLRYLSLALGVDEESIKFNQGVVTIFKADGKVIQLTNGDNNLMINGMAIPMTAAAEIVEGRTYVPVTEIGSVFGVTGTWDADTQTATFK